MAHILALDQGTNSTRSIIFDSSMTPLATVQEKFPQQSHNRMLTTIAARIDGRVTYALEGSIFIAGAAVQWLRDGLGLIDTAARTQALAEQADREQELYLVPASPVWAALAGLGRADAQSSALTSSSSGAGCGGGTSATPSARSR